MRKRTILPLGLLIITAAGGMWLALKPMPPVPVGLLARLDPTSVIGSSEAHTCTMFHDEHGRDVLQVVPLDNGWDEQRAASVIAQAISQGIRFFISSHPSRVELAGAPMFEDGRALLISTASATPKLTGKDDYLLRIIPDAVHEQRAQAQEVAQWPGKRLLVIQDTSNLAYTDTAFAVFAAELTRSSAWHIERHQLLIAKFNAAELQTVVSGDYDALYILAGSAQPVIGTIAQLFNRHHPQAPILLTPWARSPAILENAGDAAPRLILPSTYPAYYAAPAIANYYQHFRHRFGYAPPGMVVDVRQALELLEQAFKAGHRSPQAVKDYLLSKPLHRTSLGDFSFDRYGDVAGRYYFIRDVQRELQR